MIVQNNSQNNVNFASRQRVTKYTQKGAKYVEDTIKHDHKVTKLGSFLRRMFMKKPDVLIVDGAHVQGQGTLRGKSILIKANAMLDKGIDTISDALTEIKNSTTKGTNRSKEIIAEKSRFYINFATESALADNSKGVMNKVELISGKRVKDKTIKAEVRNNSDVKYNEAKIEFKKNFSDSKCIAKVEDSTVNFNRADSGYNNAVTEVKNSQVKESSAQGYYGDAIADDGATIERHYSRGPCVKITAKKGADVGEQIVVTDVKKDYNIVENGAEVKERNSYVYTKEEDFLSPYDYD